MNQNTILAVILTIISIGFSIFSTLASMSGLPNGLQAQLCFLGMAALAAYLIDQYGNGKV